ncbi:MAG TPA: hypothetical protein PLL75_06025 [Candidatus Omnitrophota bacterium]|nr:hypothetical protein [Candidatus Omnitrophota bacterium]HPS37266.1 hypothetical protein [Candidatus Omnitrophota bacterium]
MKFLKIAEARAAWIFRGTVCRAFAGIRKDLRAKDALAGRICWTGGDPGEGGVPVGGRFLELRTPTALEDGGGSLAVSGPNPS